MNDVVFKKSGMSGDAKSPAATPWGAALRLSIEYTIPPDAKVKVSFGLSCSHACLVWPHSNALVSGLTVDEAARVTSPNEEFTLVVENKTTRPIQLMVGQALLNASVLQYVPFDTV